MVYRPEGEETLDSEIAPQLIEVAETRLHECFPREGETPAEPLTRVGLSPGSRLSTGFVLPMTRIPQSEIRAVTQN